MNVIYLLFLLFIKRENVAIVIKCFTLFYCNKKVNSFIGKRASKLSLLRLWLSANFCEISPFNFMLDLKIIRGQKTLETKKIASYLMIIILSSLMSNSFIFNRLNKNMWSCMRSWLHPRTPKAFRQRLSMP